MSLFTCCTCPEPPGYDPEVDDPLPKYWNKCMCPYVWLTCDSKERRASLCGTSEFIQSTPPKKYRAYDVEGNITTNSWNGISNQKFERIWTGRLEYSVADCSKKLDSRQLETRLETSSDTEVDTCVAGFCFSPLQRHVSNRCNYPRDCGSKFSDPNISDTRTVRTVTDDSGTGSWKATLALDTEDTEADALARAPEIDGADGTAETACTSRYDLRTTAFDLIKRTATYTVTAINLCKGRAYEGCVRLRKRRSYSGTVPDDPDTGAPYVIDYENAAPDLITSFTPTDVNTTDGVTTVAIDVALPHEQGWEYQGVSAHIWPVSAECECPTD